MVADLFLTALILFSITFSQPKLKACPRFFFGFWAGLRGPARVQRAERTRRACTGGACAGSLPRFQNGFKRDTAAGGGTTLSRKNRLTEADRVALKRMLTAWAVSIMYMHDI